MDPAHIAAFSAGFLLSGTLIVAIGAQNMFVLQQGLRSEYVTAVVLFCAAADAALVAIGVAGLAGLLALLPGLTLLLSLGGALFLAVYGGRALRRAAKPDVLRAGSQPSVSLARTLLATAGFTFLNPHVYLDTVLLMGAAGSSQPAPERPLFVVGAAMASFAWFATLGFGARLLAPLFSRPRTWRVLEALVGCTMLGLAASIGWQAVHRSS